MEEHRLEVLEALADAQLALGQCAAVTGELRELVAENPYHERFWALLMLALSRSGRRADALAAYRAARQMFTTDLGMDPGSQLQRLEQEIVKGGL